MCEALAAEISAGRDLGCCWPPRESFLPFQIMDIILSDFWKGVKLVLFYKWVSDLTPVQAKEVLGAYLCLVKVRGQCMYQQL